MFTGIIETLGRVASLTQEGTNTRFEIESPLSAELQVDQSVSHNGVCLTVETTSDGCHTVVAVLETLQKSNLRNIRENDRMNLERCMLNNGRFDGHIVQGHIDQTAIVRSITEVGGSWLFKFEYDPLLGNVTVEKGSIAVNGVSLTCFDCADSGFTVSVIPYTYAHTNFNLLGPGDQVNLEFDIIGKYVKRLLLEKG